MSDPRNEGAYRVFFDVDATGKSSIVNGYGSYFQYYQPAAGYPVFRYCDNFEGKDTSGRPNPRRNRTELVRVGTTSSTGYLCADYTLSDLASGRDVIAIGSKAFFAIRTEGWNATSGGTILFKIAHKIPLLGKPKYKVVRVRATNGGAAGWTVETLIPRGPVVPTNWYHFGVSGSGLGIPNGLDSMVLNPGSRSETSVSLDGLESG